MTPGTETLTADAWLYAVLDTIGAAGGVHEEVGAEGAAYPLIVFQLLTAEDQVAVGANRWGVNGLYLVKVVVKDEGSYEPAKATAEAIDAALHRASGEVALEGVVWGCVRERPFRLNEPGYRHLGGEYRLWVTGSD